MFFAGRYSDVPVLQIGGSGFVFLLGMVLLAGGLTVESGFVDSYSYGVNGSVDSVSRVFVYDSVGTTNIAGGVVVERSIGFFLAVIGVFMFMSVMSHLGRGDTFKRLGWGDSDD